MILYDEGRWSIAFALQLHGSVADRCTVLALPCALLAVSLNLLKEMYPESALKQLEGDFSAHVHQGFSFVLGFLIVFRTQQAYSRWWEGGTLLQELRGEWFNAFSNLMAFLNHDDDPEIRAKVELFKHKMARLFSLLYGTGIEQVHTMKTPPRMQYIDPTGFRNVLAYMHSSGTHDSCELVLQWIQRLIVEANTDNIIKIAPPILARVYNQLGKGIVTLNRARKIKEFIVPFNLAQLIAVLLIVHWISTAIVCAIMLSNPAMAGLTSFTICWAFWGVNYIAVELENPFGDDSNDLPLVEMQEDMNQSIISLLRPHAIRPPVFDFDAARDADLEKALSMDFAAHENLGNGGSTSFSRFRKKKPPPLVDSCVEGNCFSGSGTYGLADDPSYRDSQLAARSPPAGPGAAPAGHGGAPAPLAAAPVGRREAPEVPSPASPANSLAALLPRAPSDGPAPARGEWNRGAGPRRLSRSSLGRGGEPHLASAAHASGSPQAGAPGSPSGGSGAAGCRGPPPSPAGLLGAAAGSLCRGGARLGPAGPQRPRAAGGAPAPGGGPQEAAGPRGGAEHGRPQEAAAVTAPAGACR